MLSRVFKRTSRIGLLSRICQIADCVVAVAGPYIERSPVEQLSGSIDPGFESLTGITDVKHRSPRRSVALD